MLQQDWSFKQEVTKKFEDLEPGDFVLYKGTPAFIGLGGTLLVGHNNGVLSHYDLNDIELTDHLTIRQILDLPYRCVVYDIEGLPWTKYRVGKGVRWKRNAREVGISDGDLAARGVKQADPLSAGEVFRVVDTRLVSGSCHLVALESESGKRFVVKVDYNVQNLVEHVELTERDLGV